MPIQMIKTEKEPWSSVGRYGFHNPFVDRDGFLFRTIGTEREELEIVDGEHSAKEYVEYIREKKIEWANIKTADISFVRECPSLRYISVGPPYASTQGYDMSPLYALPDLRMLTCRNYMGTVDGCDIAKPADIDFSQFPHLECLHFCPNPGCRNYASVLSLKTLNVAHWKNESGDLKGLIGSTELDSLCLIQSRLNCLDGIEVSHKMQMVYIAHDRRIQDISALTKVSDSLRSLHIECCPQIQDYSVLGELYNLQRLFIHRSRPLPDIQFVRKMKNLKTLILECPVADGDLTPCLDMSYAFCCPVQKHYNVREKQMPRGEFVRGNDNIEKWRRIE